MGACMRPGASQGTGVATRLVLPHFTNAVFPDRSSAHLLGLLILNTQSTKETGNSGDFCTGLKFQDIGLYLFGWFLSVHFVPVTRAMKIKGELIELIQC